MRLATYDSRTLARGAVIHADIFPGKDAQRGLATFVTHSVSDEVIEHYARQPMPVPSSNPSRLHCPARSFTPFDIRAYA